MDDIRSLHQKLAHTRHSQASWRIVLLPEAQLLSTATTNALLKIIESPPPKTLFLLTATGALSKTLASRCVSYTMAPLDPMTVVRFSAPVSPSSGQPPENTAERRIMDTAARNEDALRAEDFQGFLEDPFSRTLFLKMAQGCVGRMHYWQERMSFVKEGWDLFYRCSLGDHMMDPEWLKTAITMGPHLWEMVTLWAHDMAIWAYEQDFFWHWDGFWQATVALVRDHEIYHTDPAFLLHTICARIQGFFGYYRANPMPLAGISAVG
jgi:hypothetical protein